jgi:hypothetical protein
MFRRRRGGVQMRALGGVHAVHHRRVAQGVETHMRLPLPLCQDRAA